MACPLGRPEGAQAPWHPDKPREGPLQKPPGLCSYWGQLKYTDSIHFCQTYDAYRIFKAARRSVAWKARKEAQRGAVCQAAG